MKTQRDSVIPKETQRYSQRQRGYSGRLKESQRDSEKTQEDLRKTQEDSKRHRKESGTQGDLGILIETQRYTERKTKSYLERLKETQKRLKVTQ